MNTEIFESEKEKYIHSTFHEQLIYERYADMRNFQTALEFGNTEELHKTLNQTLENIHTVNRLYSPEQENIHVLRNQLISLNVFCMVCTFRSNPNPVYLHTVSRHYDTMIERVTTSEQMLSLVHQMVEDYCSFSMYSNQKKYSSVIQEVIWHITAEPSAKLDLNQLSRRFGMSPSSLSRKFHAETGKTLSQYQTAFRIRFAQRCFQEDNSSITQVAYRVGFTDASYFSKVFTKVTGISPSSYILQIKEGSTHK